MNKSILSFACLATVALAAPAHAGNPDGNIQIKVLGTGVLPDGKITSVVTDKIGLPAQSQTRANDRIVPTIAAEYFLSPAISVETICCITPHTVTGQGGINATKLIKNAIILPATVTLKYHFATSSKIKPYIGAGPAHFFIFSEDVDSGAAAIGATSVHLSNDWGAALQAGVDLKLNERGLGLSLDAKRYFIDTTATFKAGSVIALQTRHRLNPWVISAGLAYRF